MNDSACKSHVLYKVSCITSESASSYEAKYEQLGIILTFFANFDPNRFIKSLVSSNGTHQNICYLKCTKFDAIRSESTSYYEVKYVKIGIFDNLGYLDHQKFINSLVWDIK